MKNVLITGVAGMIGSHLLDSLLENGQYHILGLDNLSYGKIENIQHNLAHPNFKFYKTDILDFETLKILSRDIDIIVHLAAVKKIGEKQSGLPTLVTNVQGTENIFKVAKMWGCKVIFASTSDVYGMSNDLPFKEDGDLLIGPSMVKRWAYAVSKLYSEQMAYAYYKDEDVPMVILRYFGGFSPRSSFLWSGGHVPMFIKAILDDTEVTIHGDGTQTRSMAYITDIVEGTILAMENENAIGRIFNIGNDEEMSVIECAHLIHNIANTGNEMKINYIPFSEIFGNYKDILRRMPDLTMAKKYLGYSPKVSMRDAIIKTLAIIKKGNDTEVKNTKQFTI
jgi:UDP-glucose 4-epimerase